MNDTEFHFRKEFAQLLQKYEASLCINSNSRISFFFGKYRDDCEIALSEFDHRMNIMDAKDVAQGTTVWDELDNWEHDEFEKK